jgi:hypothetical protein
VSRLRAAPPTARRTHSRIDQAVRNDVVAVECSDVGRHQRLDDVAQRAYAGSSRSLIRSRAAPAAARSSAPAMWAPSTRPPTPSTPGAAPPHRPRAARRHHLALLERISRPPTRRRCSIRTHAGSSGQASTRADGGRGPCTSSQATRRAVTVLPSILSLPALSDLREPVQRWCTPERSTLNSRRSATDLDAIRPSPRCTGRCTAPHEASDPGGTPAHQAHAAA